VFASRQRPQRASWLDRRASAQLMKEGKGKPYLFVLFNDALVWVSVTSFAYKDQVRPRPTRASRRHQSLSVSPGPACRSRWCRRRSCPSKPTPPRCHRPRPSAWPRPGSPTCADRGGGPARRAARGGPQVLLHQGQGVLVRVAGRVHRPAEGPPGRAVRCRRRRQRVSEHRACCARGVTGRNAQAPAVSLAATRASVDGGRRVITECSALTVGSGVWASAAGCNGARLC
jgi:hypothetical protein